MVRASSRRRTPWFELIATAALLLLGLGWWITTHPWHLDPLSEAQVLAPTEDLDDRADVLVVLPSVPEALSTDQWATDAA